jgi:Na+-driven multidrug efflux pump
MGVDLPYPNIINAHHPNGDVVSAILAASEEAVAVAEATLLLSSSSSLKDSYTDTTPNANTAVLPSVVVPKPTTTTTTTTMDHQYSPFEEMDTADDDDDEEEDQVMMITAPSVRKIISFAIPAIGVWLCNPLLSLIDTSIVGIYSGTIQQAALNPAVAVTDYAALLMAFLYTGTTNLIAAAHTQDSKHHPNRMMMTTTTGVGTNVTTSSSRTTTTLIGVLKLSTYAGMALTTMLFVCANSLLRTLIGNDSIHPDVFHAAMKYVRIRALGMPAAAMIGSAQAACLGIQDIQSPLYVLVAAAVVNLVGDLIFVGSNHPWIGGAAGAAWATVFSQYAAATMFLYWLRHKKTIRPSPIRTKQDPYHHKKITDNDSSTGSSSSTVVNLSNAILEMTSSQSNKANVSRRQQFVDSVRSIIAPSSPITERTMNDSTRSVNRRRDMVASTGNKNVNSRSSSSPSHIPKATSAMTNKNISARGFLEGKLRKRDLIAFPNQDTLKQFAPYVIPVTTTVIGRLSGYIAMSHVVSSSFGTISMAAQQVIVSLFYCLCPIADSLSLTAQSFVPSISESTVGTQRSQVMKQTAANFYKAGSISGAVIVAAVCCIPFLSGFFTADVNVIALVNMVVPYLIGFFAVHGFVCGVEGLLLGQKDLGFLGKMYGGFFFIVPALMLQVKRAALAAADSGAVINLTSVWKIMVGYQLFRSVAWSLRLSLLQRKTESEGNLLTASVVAS